MFGLGRQAPFLGRPRGPGGRPGPGPLGGLADEAGQPFQCGPAIGFLGPVGFSPQDEFALGGDALPGQDRQTGPAVLVKPGNCLDPNAQAHGRGHLVHVLAAGSAGADAFEADVLVLDIMLGGMCMAKAYPNRAGLESGKGRLGGPAGSCFRRGYPQLPPHPHEGQPPPSGKTMLDCTVKPVFSSKSTVTGLACSKRGSSIRNE